jgi:hypothetical protein
MVIGVEIVLNRKDGPDIKEKDKNEVVEGVVVISAEVAEEEGEVIVTVSEEEGEVIVMVSEAVAEEEIAEVLEVVVPENGDPLPDHLQ